jgi:saccharopine dehydrogenase-like NADP-dependent oxidoreductase
MSAPEFDRPVPTRAVLLIGATGAFGERLAEGLVRSGIAVIAVARSRPPLLRLAERLGPLIAIEQRTRDSIDAACLQTLRDRCPNLFAVADASGPFQTSDHGLPRAAIAAGLHYVDLADARMFVRDIAAFDDDARGADVAEMSGASSTPALSHAVLDTLVADTRRIIAIDVSIAPGNRAPRGLGVVKAILSTVGQPIEVFRGGRWTAHAGWTLDKTIVLPNGGKRRVALCETPDLDLLVERFRPDADAIFRAGLELPMLHKSVAALGFLVRLGFVDTLTPLALWLRVLADVFKPFGTDRGGMQVDALIETTCGQRIHRRWTLTASGGAGPYIPTLPALAALKMLADGSLTWRGAAPCAGIVPYAVVAAEFDHYAITAERHDQPAPAPLMKRLLGDAYDNLPTAVRAAHDVGGVLVLEGSADAAGPSTLPTKLFSWLFRFPQHGTDMPLRVEMRSEDDGSETWTRIYPDVVMRSNLRNENASTGQLDEVFGPVAIRLQWRATETGLTLSAIGARVFGIPLPPFLRPRSNATESMGQDGRFRFDVAIAMPLVGEIVRYKGHLAPTVLASQPEGTAALSARAR